MSRKKAKKGRKGKGKNGRVGQIVQSFLFGDELDDATAARVRELSGLLMVGVSIWLFISLFSFYTPIEDPAAQGHNLGGWIGHYLAKQALIYLGLAAYILSLLVLCWGCIIVARKQVNLVAIRTLGGVCFVMSLAFLLDLAFGSDAAERTQSAALNNTLPYGPGGYFAYVSMEGLVMRFGSLGLWVLLLTTCGISFMLATEMAFYPAVKALSGWLDERASDGIVRAVFGWARGLVVGLWDFLLGKDLQKPAGKTPKKKAKAVSASQEELDYDDEDEEWEEEDEEELEGEDEEWEEEEEEDEEEWEEEEEEDEEEWEEEEEDEDESDGVVIPAAKRKSRSSLNKSVSAPAPIVYEPPTPPPGPWAYPPADLLDPPAPRPDKDGEFLEQSARNLENVLKSFRVNAEVVDAEVGPAVTLFELTVEEGTRMNRVTSLAPEIAGTLKAKSVRIIAPIPGKSTIGIEVPNNNRRVVRISELVRQEAYDKDFAAIPLFLGMDAEGHPIVEDLTRMPHLLIAGTTGSGKSVCINTIMASVLLTRSPHDVKMILVDPKMVELQIFQKIPHLELPVVTDMKQATTVLNWAVEKMEGRYELFKMAGVRNIKGYNKLGEEALRERMEDNFNEERTPRHVPYMVIIIDEMGDLMSQSKKDAENAITRLAQKARAVGIHVIVATQRPSTDVITGVIKGNLPTRIAFQVSSGIDSRVILDSQGAEKLLGQGDMLYSPPQSSQLRRVQGALVEDHELQALVDFVCNESVATFDQEMVQAATGTAPAGALTQGGDKVDDMFDAAVRVVLKSRRGSASLLQRSLGIGYTRASRLIDQMTDNGILGDHQGSKSREILLTLEDWEENTSNIEHAGEA
ncbi:MAG TPA: DNA translocase FtsK [Planctomycetes bacterium]|nr:DNA translocase FtsK [Planctomycetota bacterium]HIK59172.1 DNA translocase FtsK [Planctomycetota bacterium]